MAAAKKKESSGGLKEMLANLNERERRGLVGLAIFLVVLALVVVVLLFQQSMGDIEQDTRRYKASLDLLAAAGPQYVEQAGQQEGAQSHKDVSEEKLSNNDIKLTSFVAEHASATNISVTSYDEDELPFGNKKDGGPLIIEKQLRVEIRKAQMSDLVQLLDRIEKSEEPVFVKRIDVRKQRKEEGMVRAVVTVATFVRKAQDS